MSDIPTLISRARIIADDTSTSNRIVDERLSPPPDGNRKVFRLANRNVVTGSVYLTIGSSDRSNTGFTVDLVNGFVTFTTAPQANQDPFDAEYYLQWFTDAEYTEFLNEAASILSVATADLVNNGLVAALLQLSLFFFYNRRATQYANKYSSSGGQAGQQVESVTSNFRALAKIAYANGMALRDDFYAKQGQQKNPASAVIGYGFDLFTPPR